MRPQLNSGTLGSQKANRNLLAPSFVARAGIWSRGGVPCDVGSTGASTSGRAALLRSRFVQPVAFPNRTARAIHFRPPLLPVAKQAAGVSSQDRTVVATAASPSRSQGCRLKAHLSFAHGARSASRSSADFRLETVASGGPSLAVLLPSVLIPLLPNKLLQLSAAPPRHLLPPPCRPWWTTTGSLFSTDTSRFDRAAAAEQRYVGQA